MFRETVMETAACEGLCAREPAFGSDSAAIIAHYDQGDVDFDQI